MPVFITYMNKMKLFHLRSVGSAAMRIRRYALILALWGAMPCASALPLYTPADTPPEKAQLLNVLNSATSECMARNRAEKDAGSGNASAPADIPLWLADEPREASPESQLFNEVYYAWQSIERGMGASDRERLEAFKKLYAMGMPVDESDEFSYTGLGYACRLGDMASVRELLALHPDLSVGWVDDPDESEDCCCGGPAHYMPGYVYIAIENGHEDLAHFLLGKKAAPTGVRLCAREGRLDMLQKLLEVGGSVHEDDDHGRNPIFLCTNDEEVLRVLRPYIGLSPMAILRAIRVYRQNRVSYHDMTAAEGEQWEQAKREHLVKAGYVTPEDIADFERSGYVLLDRIEMLPHPNDHIPDNWWMNVPKEQALSLYDELVGTDKAAREMAAMKLVMFDWEQSYEIENASLVAMEIAGDEEFVAILSALSPEKYVAVRDALPDAMKSTTESERSFFSRFPRSLHFLGITEQTSADDEDAK